MQENIEIWKDITGTNGKYEISNFGRGRNKKKGTILKQNGSSRYLRFSINGTSQYIHRIVAIEFIENPNNLETVNHIDENKKNNNANNLEWCSFVENSRKYYGSSHSFKIGKYDKNNNLIETFESANSAGKSLKKGHSAIIECLNNNRKTAYGFKWMYIK